MFGGSSTGFGGFGSNSTTTNLPFGGVGASSTNTGTSPFGASNTSTSGGIFGNAGNSSTGFGNTSAFGSNTNTNTTLAFGSNTGGGLLDRLITMHHHHHLANKINNNNKILHLVQQTIPHQHLDHPIPVVAYLEVNQQLLLLEDLVQLEEILHHLLVHQPQTPLVEVQHLIQIPTMVLL